MSHDTDREPGAMNEDVCFEQASAWHFRLQAEDVSAAERAAFATWLLQGEPQRRAWSEVQALLGALQAPARRVQPPRRYASGWQRWAVAAVLVLGMATVLTQTPWLDRLRADYATSVGGTRVIELADGSTIQLNTDSAIRVSLHDHERRVQLLRGEAWFDVAKDADRPFIVSAGEGRVTVLGTRFGVAQREAQTQVRVEQGRVAVSSGQGSPAYLTPGQGIEYAAGELSANHPFDAPATFAWRQRQLVFRQQPLGQVVAELNRYWPGHMLVLGDALNAQVVSGVFDIDKPEAVLNALQLTLGLDVEQYTPYLRVLRGPASPR